MGAIGVAGIAWPFVNQMNPDAATVAAGAPVEVDLSPIAAGQSITVTWRGKPIFIRHRTEKEIEEARAADTASLPDPEKDIQRLRTFEREAQAQWLVVVGSCTHLGCVPVKNSGDYHGWYCPCHGSHYDTSGRIRKGPAPKNLVVPEFEFVTASKVRISGIPAA
jgi:ubiquinol-cytochrome c reductase iron-sulfur subunit